MKLRSFQMITKTRQNMVGSTSWQVEINTCKLFISTIWHSNPKDILVAKWSTSLSWKLSNLVNPDNSAINWRAYNTCFLYSEVIKGLATHNHRVLWWNKNIFEYTKYHVIILNASWQHKGSRFLGSKGHVQVKVISRWRKATTNLKSFVVQVLARILQIHFTDWSVVVGTCPNLSVAYFSVYATQSSYWLNNETAEG